MHAEQDLQFLHASFVVASIVHCKMSHLEIHDTSADNTNNRMKSAHLGYDLGLIQEIQNAFYEGLAGMVFMNAMKGYQCQFQFQ